MCAWKQTSLPDTWDFETSPVLEGVYKSKRTNIGINSSNAYEFEVDGKLVSIWGSTVIDSQMSRMQEGWLVKIEYKGKTKSPKTGKFYKDFQFFYDDEQEIPVIEDDPDFFEKEKAGLGEN